MSSWKHDQVHDGCDVYINLKPYINTEKVDSSFRSKLDKLHAKAAKKGNESSVSKDIAYLQDLLRFVKNQRQ